MSLVFPLPLPSDRGERSELTIDHRKVGQVIFNPTASSVLASASGDYLVKLWDIDNGKDTASITLNGHKDIIQSIAWNAVGNVLATVSSLPLHFLSGRRTAKSSEVDWKMNDKLIRSDV